MYLLDKRVSSSILLAVTFMSKNTSREVLTFVLNYLIDYLKITAELSPNYLRDYSSLSHNRKKVNCYWGCNYYRIATIIFC